MIRPTRHRDLKPGMVITTEYGDYGNWVTGKIISAEPSDTLGYTKIVLEVKPGTQLEMYGRAEELVKVIEGIPK